MKSGKKKQTVSLEAKNLYKIIDGVEILRDINLKIYSGEKIAFIGESGAGKTTLLQILGLLDSLTSGELMILGKSVACMKDTEKTDLRLRNIGFVYQQHHLIEELTVRENILLPLRIAQKDHEKDILDLVEKLGLSSLLDRMPHTLSGGEKQRVSILRAAANFPNILLADEPTGNLDTANADAAMDLFLTLVKRYKMTVVIVTHNLEIAKRMDRVIQMKDGVFV
ncbi:MAG: ABC transporter ATP-binding protein [Alphaproteobacteria bacterium]|nr:MAG: ABC transporter ATP-binding protein [Alphaproteobacteria bacterium]